MQSKLERTVLLVMGKSLSQAETADVLEEKMESWNLVCAGIT